MYIVAIVAVCVCARASVCVCVIRNRLTDATCLRAWVQTECRRAMYFVPDCKKNANALVLKINRILVMTGLTSLLSLKLLRLEPEVIQLIANSLEVSGEENISPSQSVTPP